jgi:hypothetical protein
MDPLQILALVNGMASLAKAAPAIIDQARTFMGQTDDQHLKAALADALAAYEEDHARVMDKLRAAASQPG